MWNLTSYSRNMGGFDLFVLIVMIFINVSYLKTQRNTRIRIILIYSYKNEIISICMSVVAFYKVIAKSYDFIL